MLQFKEATTKCTGTVPTRCQPARSLVQSNALAGPLHTRHNGRKASTFRAAASALDDPSDMWRPPGTCASEYDASAADGPLKLPDGPALDYVRRYPAPADDDPNAQTPARGPWEPGWRGPDPHAATHYNPVLAAGGGARDGDGGGAPDGSSVLAALRQRALSGSSDEEGEEGADDERWRAMDIPALLMSPHHAAALASLSSCEEDTAAAPDFADLNVPREAAAAAAAAAELVPPELVPLARAANMLSYLTARGGLAGLGEAAAVALEPPLHLQASRFAGLPNELLTAEQLEAAAMVMNNIAPAAGLSYSMTAASAAVDAGVEAEVEDAAMIGGVAPSKVGSSGSGGGSGGAAAAAARATASALRAAAMAAVVAEEGVDWLGSAAGGGAAAAQQHEEEEDRSVQLRRAPQPEAAEGGLDPALRDRLAAALAREAQEADAHVVTHHAAASLGGGDRDGGASSSPRGERPTGRFVLPKAGKATSAAAGAARGAEALVEGVTAAVGKAAADAAAAAVAAEARQAVWGEGGWPYDAAMRSTDVVEELKVSIHRLQDEAEHGSPSTLLP